MKLIPCLLCIFFGYTSLGQHIIKLSYKDKAFPGYRILKAKDTAFVKVGYGEDMGVPYGNYYRLKDSLPDGHYQVYVNDTIAEDVFFKNHKPHNVRITYVKGLKASQQTFLNDEETLILGFYPNGKTEQIAKIKEKAPYIRVSYYETGSIRMLEYIIKHTHSRVEYFDEKGYVSQVRDEYNPDARFVAAEVLYNKGRFEGKHLIRFIEGDFEVEFSNNKVVNWRFSSKGVILNEFGFSQGKEEK